MSITVSPVEDTHPSLLSQIFSLGTWPRPLPSKCTVRLKINEASWCDFRAPGGSKPSAELETLGAKSRNVSGQPYLFFQSRKGLEWKMQETQQDLGSGSKTFPGNIILI